jgi:hypothetical protein
MPLEFESLNHGRIAFGFFNIETDMILFNQYFLFAEDFCQCISEASQKNEPIFKTSLEGYSFQNTEDIGNLMGAIYGVEFRGFIGEVYKLFPFPKKQEDFKQKPEGFKTRTIIEKLIQKFGKGKSIPFLINHKPDQIAIGEYLFSKASFHELIQYIWLGGFPRWKENLRPDYVSAMKKIIGQFKNPIFEGLTLL